LKPSDISGVLESEELVVKLGDFEGSEWLDTDESSDSYVHDVILFDTKGSSGGSGMNAYVIQTNFDFRSMWTVSLNEVTFTAVNGYWLRLWLYLSFLCVFCIENCKCQLLYTAVQRF
jgi:hypothetical protein